MSHHGTQNEAVRWEEYRVPQTQIRNTRLLGPSESYSTVGPPSHHDRQASRVPSSLVASDARSAEDSGDGWWGDISRCSSTSDRKIHSTLEFSRSQTPPSECSIEISPGVHVRLRGADETWKAIEHDYYMPAECICCESTVFCIQDADYVLCPDCRVVIRLGGSSSRGIGGGVSLGFKYEDLARWQEDILRARQEETQRELFESVPRHGEWGRDA
jgi:hypothetical protein